MSLLTQFYGSGGGGGTGLPVEILLVGGGGGGGGVAAFQGAGSAGGGSGQFLYGTYHFDYDKSVTVTIGAGGAGGTGPGAPNFYGLAGGDSKFGYVVAYGGGGGSKGPDSGFSQYDPTYRSNQNYGSSGGVLMPATGFKVVMGSQPLGAEYITRLGEYGGPRTVDSSDGPVTTEAYALIHGFISGRKTTPHGFIATGAGNLAPPTAGGGGGGGAGGAPPGPIGPYNIFGSIGSNPSAPNDKYITNGGAGLPGSVIGYPTLEFAGGGGGGSQSSVSPSRAGDGAAGGGDGGRPAPLGGTLTGGNATANSGSGGGGAANAGAPTISAGGNGGSGVCIIRYPTQYSAATVSGNTPTPAQPGYYVYRWNGPGSITFNA